MKPSLFSLFKRGRYFRLPSTDVAESSDADRVHREVERFVAAAIGFCMQHNNAFKRFFLLEVCGITPKGKRITIDVEPQNWADLMIVVGRLRCVVEFKIGASLQRHQNPAEEEQFWAGPSGYGYRMEDAFGTSP